MSLFKGWNGEAVKAKGYHIDTGKKILGAKEEKKKRVIKTASSEKDTLEFILKAAKVEYVKEHTFSERRFKFDYAIPGIKVAVEYEGLVFGSNKSTSSGKSGHTTVIGFTNNCSKYNLALLLGWRVLRYTAINYKEFADDLDKILNEQK